MNVLVPRSLVARTLARSTRLRTIGPSRTYVGGPGNTEHGNDPETIEKEKEKSLSGSQKGDHSSEPMPEHAPGWNQKLASSSEAAAKADRSSGSPEELQKKTTREAEGDRSGRR